MSKVAANTPLELIESVYAKLGTNVAIGRRRLGRSMTLAEKILFGHMQDAENDGFERGKTYGDFFPDRVAMQDATAQMALLQFMTAGLPQVAVPATPQTPQYPRQPAAVALQAYAGRAATVHQAVAPGR